MNPCRHDSTGPIAGNGIDYWNTLKHYRTLQKEQPDLWKHFRDSAKNAGADVSLPSVRRVGDVQKSLPKRDQSPRGKKTKEKKPPATKSRAKKKKQ